MNEPVTVEVMTQVFGLGGGRSPVPTFVELTVRKVSVRHLIAEHVRAELVRVEQRRASSLALQYLLADDPREERVTGNALLDMDGEIKRALAGLTERRYLLVVDGVSLDDLDASVCLTEQSHISFVRLLPLVGG